MMRPPPRCFRCGIPSRHIRPKKISDRCTAVSHCSSVAVEERAKGGPPELLTRMSMPPNCSSAAAISPLMLSSRSRSAGNASTSAPVDSRISSAACSRSAAVRLQMTTLEPSSASTCAQARPSPLLAPPMIATLSFSPRSIQTTSPRPQIGRRFNSTAADYTSRFRCPTAAG